MTYPNQWGAEQAASGRRNLWRGVAVGAALLLLAVGIGWWAVARSDAGDEAAPAAPSVTSVVVVTETVVQENPLDRCDMPTSAPKGTDISHFCDGEWNVFGLSGVPGYEGLQYWDGNSWQGIGGDKNPLPGYVCYSTDLIESLGLSDGARDTFYRYGTLCIE
ncbi:MULTISPECIES: hypothetical protein [Corynebacterium]|uniref:Uncharacterized protein n=2 Tax=Corynebacterium glucuronolyticum TaxID=39791 RepID=A0AAX1L6S8_9CORY|nr:MULTISPECIES: hypothetical protein [Corynebacterium]EEI62389.1 Tat pathway signal sequence domain protein [Corynebacterium glucuronolyticum ATCC 51866]MCT1442156.1 hypothetical protein [Corynebacterium glucuronolyticum]MCT1563713.1 hypothetical protein [Corynebacterium glucuronolyticum]OFO49663.1 hypothetical protein HMPREF3044_00125 [Corynebacterium sp. HMSC073D01]QRP70126.1 hypothetical protein I6J21_10125 [Corynebacterium glucuronolyticum]